MPIEYVPYAPQPVEGQAVLNNLVRTRRLLTYRGADGAERRIARGLPLYHVATTETVGNAEEFGPESGNLLLHSSCLAACAYLKDRGVAVDLVYIDPPFASGADYAKKLFLRRNPRAAETLVQAEAELNDEDLAAFEENMYGDIWNKESYLNWMFENLIAIKAVMSEKASIYLHIDSRTGPYIKVILDEIFGESNFVNHIIWWYYNKMQGNVGHFANNHDSIYWYRKSDGNIFMPLKEERDEPVPQIKRVWNKEKKKVVNAKGADGKVIYQESTHRAVDDVWRISMLQPADQTENTGYPTQKPEALLERIIMASSEEGMLVADFFGGSGTTARVAHRLGRRFFTSDVGINSLQTSRDTLHDAGAAFTIAEVRDGVALFRNPVQTMARLGELIPGLAKSGVPEPWYGQITSPTFGPIPVYLPNLMDTASRVLDVPALNHLLTALPDLDDATKKVVIYYVDVSDLSELEQFQRENNATTIEVELRDLKEVLAEAVMEDHVELTVHEEDDKFTVTIERFFSDRLLQAVEAFNQKKNLPRQASLYDGTEVAEREAAFREAGGLTLSDEGLEGIEAIFVDTTNVDGPWHTDAEVRIDTTGYLILDGEKTKDFWDGTLAVGARPLRIKVRSILGDETVIALSPAVA